MGKEKPPITEKEFEKYKIKGFAQANSELKVFARGLADYCWKLDRSEEHTSELQSHSFISYAVFCLKKKKQKKIYNNESDNKSDQTIIIPQCPRL